MHASGWIQGIRFWCCNGEEVDAMKRFRGASIKDEASVGPATEIRTHSRYQSAMGAIPFFNYPLTLVFEYLFQFRITTIWLRG